MYNIKKILFTAVLIAGFSVAVAAGEKENSFIILPVASYTPETSLSGQIVTAYLYRFDKKDLITPPSSFQFSMAATLNSQFNMYFESNTYMKNSEYYYKIITEYKKWPDKLYGIGSSTPDSSEEKYGKGLYYLWVDIFKKTTGNLFIGIKYILQHVSMFVQREGEVTFGLLPDSIYGYEGGTESGLGLQLKWDTRDNNYFATKGSLWQVLAVSFGSTLGSEYIYNRLDIDLRQYIKLNKSNSIALQLFAGLEDGNPPFYSMNIIGGNKMMRGYYEGRFRDKCLLALQSEYRLIFHDHLAASLHFSYGSVVDELKNLLTDKFKLAAGFGFRFFMDPVDRFSFRLDFGWGNACSGIYVVAGEAF